MKMIKISGEIVDGRYDCDFFADWIKGGVICPSTRPIAKLTNAEDGDDVRVFVDSPGGDVFAGDAIIIAALDAQKRCNSFTVEVGSEACSMAANFIAALKAAGASVAVHSNSKVMFHSAATVAEGGAEVLKDRAQLVTNINEAVKANLAKVGVTDCEDWFAEGREKWLSADELKTLGLADEILEAAAEEKNITESVKAFRAAALKKAEADAGMNWEARFKGASKKINELTAERDSLKAQLDELTAKAKTDADAVAKQFNDQIEGLRGNLAEAEAKVSGLTHDLEQKTHDLEVATATLSEKDQAITEANEHIGRLQEARQLLTAGVLTPAPAETYESQMAKAKTAEAREALRARKAKGLIK